MSGAGTRIAGPHTVDMTKEPAAADQRGGRFCIWPHDAANFRHRDTRATADSGLSISPLSVRFRPYSGPCCCSLKREFSFAIF